VIGREEMVRVDEGEYDDMMAGDTPLLHLSFRLGI